MTTNDPMYDASARVAKVLADAAQVGGHAIRLDGRFLVVSEDKALELEASRVPFAYVCWCSAALRYVTVPVN